MRKLDCTFIPGEIPRKSQSSSASVSTTFRSFISFSRGGTSSSWYYHSRRIRDHVSSNLSCHYAETIHKNSCQRNARPIMLMLLASHLSVSTILVETLWKDFESIMWLNKRLSVLNGVYSRLLVIKTAQKLPGSRMQNSPWVDGTSGRE